MLLRVYSGVAILHLHGKYLSQRSDGYTSVSLLVSNIEGHEELVGESVGEDFDWATLFNNGY